MDEQAPPKIEAGYLLRPAEIVRRYLAGLDRETQVRNLARLETACRHQQPRDQGMLAAICRWRLQKQMQS